MIKKYLYSSVPLSPEKKTSKFRVQYSDIHTSHKSENSKINCVVCGGGGGGGGGGLVCIYMNANLLNSRI